MIHKLLKRPIVCTSQKLEHKLPLSWQPICQSRRDKLVCPNPKSYILNPLDNQLLIQYIVLCVVTILYSMMSKLLMHPMNCSCLKLERKHPLS